MRVIIAFALLFAFTSAQAQEPQSSGGAGAAKADTTQKKGLIFGIGPGESGDSSGKRGIHVELGNTKKIKDKYDIRWVMFDLGVNTYSFDGSLNLPRSLDVYELNYSRSLHFNVRIFEQRLAFGNKRHLSVFQGINFEWQNFHLQNDYLFEPGKPEVTPVLSDKALSKNRFSTRLITAPIGLQLETNPDNMSKSFHLGAGVYGGFLYGASQRTRIEDSKDKNRVTDDFNLNKFRWGLLGRIGYGPINFYVQYSMTPLFKSGEGPELTPIQFGVTLIPY
jgi:hypothetical protein